MNALLRVIGRHLTEAIAALAVVGAWAWVAALADAEAAQTAAKAAARPAATVTAPQGGLGSKG